MASNMAAVPINPTYPPSSPSESIQNYIYALRVATDCVKLISLDHLYEDTKMIPVEDHLASRRSPHQSTMLTISCQRFPT